jgi:anti-anti-sigma factor
VSFLFFDCYNKRRRKRSAWVKKIIRKLIKNIVVKNKIGQLLPITGERNMGLGISGFNEELDDCLTVNARKISEIESSCLLKLTGYIDTYNSAFFQKKTDMLLNAGYNNFILDCSDLNYISSTGIGSLASFLRNTQSKNGHLVLVSLQESVHEVFVILGFTQFFTVKNTEAEALEALREAVS